MLALSVLQNPTVVNLSQDMGGPKALVLTSSQDLACLTAAGRAEQDLWEERKSFMPCFAHSLESRFTERSLL